MNETCGGCLSHYIRCGPGPECPPLGFIFQESLDVCGPALQITKEDLVCDYGQEILELGQLACLPEPECGPLDASLAAANAYVYMRLSVCYQLPLKVCGKVLDASFDPSLEPAGSPAKMVYSLLRRWVGIVARYYLWRDAKIVKSAEGISAKYENYETIKKELDGQLDACKDLLPMASKRLSYKSAFLVSGRERSPLPRPTYNELGLGAVL